VVVAVAKVVAATAAAMKTLVATAMAGVTGNNQPKLAAEDMAAETVLAMVTTMTMARTMTVATGSAMMVAFLPDRQQSTSTKRCSRRNGGGKGNSNGDWDSNNSNDGVDDNNNNGKDNDNGKEDNGSSHFIPAQ
jgi:hypothetical protein